MALLLKGVVASVPISKQSSISTSGINGTTDGSENGANPQSFSIVIFHGEGDQQPWKLRCYAIFEQSHIYIYTYTYIHIHIIHTHESRMPTDFATARPRSTDQFCWGPDRLKPPLEGPVSFSKASLSFASNPACADCDFIQAWNSPNTWYTGESVKTDVPVFGWLNVMASCLRMCRKNG